MFDYPYSSLVGLVGTVTSRIIHPQRCLHELGTQVKILCQYDGEEAVSSALLRECFVALARKIV